MRIYLTGGLRIEHAETVVDHRAFGGADAQLVLAYLVCERDRPVARTEIVELLEASGGQFVNADDLLDRLGRSLASNVPSSQLRLAPATIELTFPRDTWVDVEAAADAIHEAESAIRAGHVANAFGPSAIAHHIARRPFLPGVTGSWAQALRDRLHTILVRAIEARGEVFLWNDEAPLAVEAAREVVKLEPYRETGHRLLMRALAASGNTAEAIRAFERCRQMLLEGLRIEPSDQTRRVIDALAPSAASNVALRTASPQVPRSSPAPMAAIDLAAGIRQTLGDAYVLERELSGGMSRVWVANERALDRRVVIKVLPPEMAEMVAADRFVREARLVARLQHPNIVPVFAVGVLDAVMKLPYYTMPYVAGESLRAALTATPRLPVSRVASILRDVARALAFAHGEGVIHRDIKPENVLLTGDAAVVTDFGIAKAMAGTMNATVAPTSRNLTGLGQTLGTPQYMAPEQLIADPAVDARADIYSFGVVAYEMLAGHRPFAAGNLSQQLAAQLTERPADVRTLRPDTPTNLAALVMTCVEPRREARIQSMAEVLVTFQ